MAHGRLLGIDLGDVRTGIAVCDDDQLVALPVTTLTRLKPDELIAAILELCVERSVVGLVLGLPYNMDGSEGPKAKQIRAFAEKLAQAGAPPLEFQDERLTSWEAEGHLIDAGIKPSKRKGKIDALAAKLILQAFIDQRRDNQG